MQFQELTRLRYPGNGTTAEFFLSYCCCLNIGGDENGNKIILGYL
jgi:hypothetical protein